jgi:drug/metabolite transporter (DMT)-like permease
MGSIANYSLYLLCGGMVLPVLYGACVGDAFDFLKIASLILIIGAIAIKFNAKEKTDKKALLYFGALFLLNGLVGVVSSVHQGNLFAYAKVSSVELMILNSAFTILLAFIVFGVMAWKKRREINFKNYFKATPWAMCDGILNGVANLFLLISLQTLAPSLQYPIVTGGTIFLSALFGYLFYKEKPTRRVLISVALAIVGTVLMGFSGLL